jgi:phosphoserine phosphatase
MVRERLYIVHGRGNDAVGLVGSITAPLGEAGGNIVDLRQDVLHGRFTLDMIVDLAGSRLRFDDFSAMLKELGEDTGLALTVERYQPVPRSPDQQNLLLILLGNDQPGIIASVSETLGKYRANIEAAQTIGREGMFLMELLTDVSQCRVPLPNLMATIEAAMQAKGMKTIFQTEDVFNKQKRGIVFNVTQSLVEPTLCAEILQQTGLGADSLASAYRSREPLAALRHAAACLEGLPAAVMSTIVEGINPSRGSMELMQTLKTMGYKIALVSHAFTPLTEHLKLRLGLDYSRGVRLHSDDDSQACLGGVSEEDYAAIDPERMTAQIAEQEGISQDEVAFISDAGLPGAPGLRLEFDLGQLLHLFNQHVISSNNLVGILGSFGLPRS